jgi:hypothetical protein
LPANRLGTAIATRHRAIITVNLNLWMDQFGTLKAPAELTKVPNLRLLLC